jgi:hypothetical protein
MHLALGPICEEKVQSNYSPFTTRLTRISHTFSEQIAALPIEIASQVGEDSVHATRPRPLERQDHRAECASCQRKCKKCGLPSLTCPVLNLMGEFIVSIFALLGLRVSALNYEERWYPENFLCRIAFFMLKSTL